MIDKLREADPVELLRSINYVDSALFGISIDIFKLRLFVTAQQSLGLARLGFDEGAAFLCMEFRSISNLKMDIDKSVFGPPYLDDGNLSALDLLNFDFDDLDLRKVGATGLTDRSGEYREMRDVYEVRFTFRNAALRFRFADLEITTFEPETLDIKHSLDSAQA
jgi:hypothetical protein